MLRRSVLVPAALSLVFCGLGTVLAAGWTVVDLGAGDGQSPGNHPYSSYWSAGINNLGNVAYTLGDVNFNTWPQSYFYNKSAHATVPLGDLGGGATEVFGINDHNIVAGESYATPTSDFATAVVWKWNGSTGGTMFDLRSTIGVTNMSSAWAINNNNQVTGYNTYAGLNNYYTPYVADVTHAFDPTPSTTVKWLPIPGQTGTHAGGQGISINDIGCVVSQGIDVPTTNSYYDGGDPSLSASYAKPMAKAPGVGEACYTSAINNAGYALCTAPTVLDKIGWVVNTTPGSNVTAYDRDVPPLVADGTNMPVALNNNAIPQVVGYASTAGGDRHAFIWNYGDSTATDLNAYAAAVGAANLSGWVFQYANSINNNREIVGYGTLNGVSHAFALLISALPGDANMDGTVDTTDLSRILTSYNKSGMTWTEGDFDGNGTIDAADLSKVLTNYDKTAAAGAGGGKAVPEPSAFALLVIAAIAPLAYARRKGRR